MIGDKNVVWTVIPFVPCVLRILKRSATCGLLIRRYVWIGGLIDICKLQGYIFRGFSSVEYGLFVMSSDFVHMA